MRSNWAKDASWILLIFVCVDWSYQITVFTLDKFLLIDIWINLFLRESPSKEHSVFLVLEIGNAIAIQRHSILIADGLCLNIHRSSDSALTIVLTSTDDTWLISHMRVWTSCFCGLNSLPFFRVIHRCSTILALSHFAQFILHHLLDLINDQSTLYFAGIWHKLPMRASFISILSCLTRSWPQMLPLDSPSFIRCHCWWNWLHFLNVLFDLIITGKSWVVDIADLLIDIFSSVRGQHADIWQPWELNLIHRRFGVIGKTNIFSCEKSYRNPLLGQRRRIIISSRAC